MAAESAAPEGKGRADVTTSSKRERRQSLLADLFGHDDVPNVLSERLLHTSDVATLFQVSERTVAEWARRGRIPCVKTPGGHRRYPAEEIRKLLVESRNGS